MTLLKKLSAWPARHKSDLHLTTRVTMAGLVAFAVNHVFHLPQGYWTVLTAVLVVQGSVGGSIKVAVDRMIGTVGGAVYGAIVASLLPQASFGESATALGAGLVPTALLAALNPSFRIAPVTVIIVLFSTASAQMGVIHYAVDRMLEIGLGAVIGLGVSLVFLPARAHSLVADAAGKVLLLDAQLVSTLLSAGGDAPKRGIIDIQQKKIRDAMTKLDIVAEEAKRERTSYLTGDPDPEPLLRTLRRLRHDLVMIARSTTQPFPDDVAERLAPALSEISLAVVAILNQAGRALGARAQPELEEPFDTAFDSYATALTKAREDHLLRPYPADLVARIFALGFALEQMRLNLRDMINRVGEFSRPAGLKKEHRHEPTRPADAV